MKLMIASDIHGSEYYCQLMLEAYDREKADRLLLLGDILYHGPRNDLPRDYNPKRVIELLNKYCADVLCVGGNCDAQVDQMVLDFPVLADYCIILQDELTIYATHGHVHNPENPLPMNKGDILLNGHTHIPEYREYETFTYINPGSVSIPKENSWHGYITFENRVFEWKDIEGTVKLRKKF